MFGRGEGEEGEGLVEEGVGREEYGGVLEAVGFLRMGWDVS